MYFQKHFATNHILKCINLTGKQHTSTNKNAINQTDKPHRVLI